MKKISAYVGMEVLTPFLGGFFFFLFIFLMFQIVRLAEFFINHGVGLDLLLKLTVYLSAAFMPVVLPVSFLVAILVGFGRLSADSEVVAFKASGVSLGRLYRPIAMFSIIVALAIFYLTNWFIPWGNYQFKRTLVRLGSTKVVSNLKEGTFTEGFFDLLVYADKVDPQNNKMKGVFIYDERDSKHPNTIVAKEGQIIPVKSDNEFTTINILKLTEGAIHRSYLEREVYEKIDYSEYRTLLKVEEGSTADITYPKTLSSPVLRGKIKELGSDPQGLEYQIEYWKRVALSISPLIFGLLGVGLGVVKNRSVKSYALFVAFGVVALYWALHIAGQSLAESGVMHAAFSMQISNLVAIPIAYLSFRESSW